MVEEKKQVEGASSVEKSDTEHYEEVSEYRIGEGPPPLFLIVMFALIVIWAAVSWLPYKGLY